MLSKIRSEKGIYVAVILQAAAVLLAAFGFLPREAMLFSTIVIGLYILTLPPLVAFKLFILLLPWYVAVPLGSYDRLQSWRIFILEIFLLALYRGKIEFKFSKIDYSFFAFLASGLLASNFLGVSLRYVIWLLSVYLVFVVARSIIKEESEKTEIIKAASYSLMTIAAAGFIQLFIYLFTQQLLFWQYWAGTFIPVLYGSELALVVSRFNSWFAYFQGGPPGLRMFSLLPGSHYFALIGALGLAFLLRMRELNKKKWSKPAGLAMLAVVFSSVRGAWLGALAPVAVIFILFLFNKFSRLEFKKAISPFLIFFAMFLISPLANKIFSAVSPYHQGIGNFYTRAGSSFNTRETSNNMRLEVWKAFSESVKKHPVFGLGFGNFPLVFGNPQNKSLSELANENDPIVGIPKKHVSAHNLVLQVLVESGILGLAAFFAFLYFIFSRLWNKFKTHQSGWALFFALSLIWVLGQEMFDTSFLLNDKTLILFWLGLALSDA